MRFTKRPRGVCSVGVSFDLDDNIVHNVQFTGGCDGNLKAISKLVDGMTVEQIYSKLKGNQCRAKGTSCADQFATLIMQAYEESRQ